MALRLGQRASRPGGGSNVTANSTRDRSPTASGQACTTRPWARSASAHRSKKSRGPKAAGGGGGGCHTQVSRPAGWGVDGGPRGLAASWRWRDSRAAAAWLPCGVRLLTCADQHLTVSAAGAGCWAGAALSARRGLCWRLVRGHCEGQGLVRDGRSPAIPLQCQQRNDTFRDVLGQHLSRASRALWRGHIRQKRPSLQPSGTIYTPDMDQPDGDAAAGAPDATAAAAAWAAPPPPALALQVHGRQLTVRAGPQAASPLLSGLPDTGLTVRQEESGTLVLGLASGSLGRPTAMADVALGQVGWQRAGARQDAASMPANGRLLPSDIISSGPRQSKAARAPARNLAAARRRPRLAPACSCAAAASWRCPRPPSTGCLPAGAAPPLKCRCGGWACCRSRLPFGTPPP